MRLLIRISFVSLVVLWRVASAQDYDINLSLDGTQAGTPSAGTGTETGSGINGCHYDASSKVLTITFSFTGLTGTTTAAHIHGPALAGVGAGVVIGFPTFPTGVTSGSYSSTFTLDAGQESDLLGGLYYANIHSSAYGAGEIRGQLNIGSVLPVELTSFNASIKDDDVELAWRTATEVNNYGFEIERTSTQPSPSKGGGRWTKVGFVEGGGMSSAPRNYAFTDKNLASGRYQYRLKQLDRDGVFKYSQVVEAIVDFTPRDFSLSQNYPNPFNPVTHVQLTISDLQFVHLGVFDVLGQEVGVLVNEWKSAGNFEVSWDGANFPSGVYYYKLQAGNIVETKKMMLMK